MHELLELAIEEHLAGLSDDDWAALTARVRPPGARHAGKLPTEKEVPL